MVLERLLALGIAIGRFEEPRDGVKASLGAQDRHWTLWSASQWFRSVFRRLGRSLRSGELQHG